MSDTKTAQTTSITFTGALFLLFLALRLTDQIDWSWAWVAAPLWGPLAVALAILVVVLVVVLPIAAVIDVVNRVRCRRAAARKVGW